MEDQSTYSQATAPIELNSATSKSKPNSSFLNFIDANNPYRVDHGDSTTVIFITDLLTADNYVTWSQAMRQALRVRNKLGFIDESLVKPTDPGDPLFDAWERYNDMVVSWIHNSISPAAKSSVAFMDDVQNMWNELQLRFTQQNWP